MMNGHTPFIGVGHNPEGPDLPLGLGMMLAQEPDAIDSFGKLTTQQKENLVRYIQSSTTGEDAQLRIVDTVKRLKNNDLSLFQ